MQRMAGASRGLMVLRPAQGSLNYSEHTAIRSAKSAAL